VEGGKRLLLDVERVRDLMTADERRLAVTALRDVPRIAQRIE
jgi:hypothetical protein